MALTITLTEKGLYKITNELTDYPSTILGIAIVESQIGKSCYRIGDGGDSRGMFQIQVPTLRWFATKEESLSFVKKYSDEYLASRLQRNDIFSAYVTTKLFEYNRKHYGYKSAIMRHNGLWEVTPQGRAIRINGHRVKNFKYVNKVLKAKQDVRVLNQRKQNE